FERGPHRDQLDHLAFGFAHHVDAAARNRAHEAFAFELRHGLAHRRPADAEILRQAPFVEPDLSAAAIDVHRGDRVLERRVGLPLETRRAGQRTNRDLRRQVWCAGLAPDRAQEGGTRTHVVYIIPESMAGKGPPKPPTALLPAPLAPRGEPAACPRG